MRYRGLGWGTAVVLLVGTLLAACQPAATPQEAAKAAPPAASPQAASQQAKPAPATSPEAVAKPAAATPVKGGTLRIYQPSNPGSLDPAYAAGSERNVAYSLYDALLDYDGDLKPTTNGLTEAYELAKDGKSVVLKLRKGVKFHDGTDFNADAVKFNLERILDKDTKSPVRGYISDIASIEVLDPYTVRLNLSNQSAPILSNLAYLPGMMASPTAVKKYGKDFGRNPVGAGPFQIVEWVQGDHVTVKRFDGYWMKDRPYLDQIVFKVIPDTTVGATALRTGDIDEHRYITGSDLPPIRQDPKLRVSKRTHTSWWGIHMNNKLAPFDNKLVRQALSWAIDREKAVKAVFGDDGAIVISTPLLPDTWEYDPNLKPYMPRDVAKAKAMLAEAGYPNGFKSTLATSTKKHEQLLAQIYQQNLAEIGVQVEIETYEPAPLLDLRNSVNYKLLISGQARVGDPDSMLYRFTTDNPRGGMAYGNPKVDELLNAGRRTYDTNERTRIYREAAKLIADDAPGVFVYAENVQIGLNKRVQDYVHYSDSIARYRNVWVQP